MDTMNTMNPTKNFGFGLMRLPRLEGPGDVIDVEQVKVMVDKFLEAGLTYFDTAYVYAGSEVATKKALVERHPRDSYTLATKLNVRIAKDKAAAMAQFDESLERTGAGYFDYYLLHCITRDTLSIFDDWDIWGYARELKAKGLIRHYGFSFHDSPELLEEILKAHGDVEFVQLQINYADWEDPTVCSRRCYEIARKYNKPVIVMEPVKGGLLADPPASIAKLLKDAAPDASYASWAIRFAASLEGVMVVLSGMSNIAQAEDNLSYMADFKPMSEEEQAVIKKAQAELARIDSIPCTGCRYCTKGCPMQISIPSVFTAMNRIKIFNNPAEAAINYKNAIAAGGKASDCIHCGQCEGACPQHLPIISLLEECAAALE